MTPDLPGPPGLTGDALAAYRAGVAAGYDAGFADASTGLDDAGEILAGMRPSRSLGVAAARAARHQYRTPALSAEQIRARAYTSWGLPLPATDTARGDHSSAGSDTGSVEGPAPEPDPHRARPPRGATPAVLAAWFLAEAAHQDAAAVRARARADVLGAVDAEVRAARARLDARDLTATPAITPLAPDRTESEAVALVGSLGPNASPLTPTDDLDTAAGLDDLADLHLADLADLDGLEAAGDLDAAVSVMELESV